MPGSPLVGMTNNCEIQKGVIIAASLTRVVDGYAITSILTTQDTEVNVHEPLVGFRRGCSDWENRLLY